MQASVLGADVLNDATLTLLGSTHSLTDVCVPRCCAAWPLLVPPDVAARLAADELRVQQLAWENVRLTSEVSWHGVGDQGVTGQGARE